MTDALKVSPDDNNEVHDILTFQDKGVCRVTPVAQFSAEVALAVVTALTALVRAAHSSPAATTPDADGIVRAQTFEEGNVYLLGTPYDGYFADRYLMDFYNVNERDICSRMHLHTGLRFVRMMTGPDTRIRVSSLSPIEVVRVDGVTPFDLQDFADEMPDTGDGDPISRYNLVVPPNSWVDMQVPRGVSHQFNAIGPNAVIDSVHPEESIETFREKMSGYRMMAQTIFLADELPAAHTCNTLPPPVPSAMTSSDASDELDRQIADAIRSAGDGDGLSADETLAKLDSLGLVALVVQLESAAGIKLGADQIVRENFASLLAVRALVDSCRARPMER